MKAIIYSSKSIYPYKVVKYLKYRIKRIGKRDFIIFMGEFNSIVIPVEALDHFAIIDDNIITED